jgi:ABC-2 type transport system permease protein
MTAGTTHRPTPSPTARPVAGRAPASAVTATAVRQVRRGTAIVALLCGGMAATVVTQYRGLEGALGMESLSALAENPAIRTLFGPPVALDDPGGFTVWRTGTFLAVLAGTWAALTATRLTRGEEEAGRWDLLLAGRVTLRSLVARTLAVLLCAAAVPGVAVGITMVLSGAATPGAVVFASAIAGVGMTGAALGVLAAQLFPERRAASGLAVTMLLGGLLARMVADGVDALAWLHWLTPFGLIGRAAPFAGNRVLPLVVLACLAALFAVAAATVTAGRDVGSGRLRGRDRGRAPSRLLGSLAGLAVHRTRRPTLTWGLGLAAYFLLIGLLATAMVDFLRDNPVFAELAERAGVVELGSVEGYAASLFSLLAVPIGAFAAGQIAAAAHDEAGSRLALLFSLPVARTRWAAIEAATVALGCLVLAAVAGLATWAGTAWVGAGLGPGDAVWGALSVVPVALLCLGAALAALGWAPQAVLALGVLPAAGGYLLLVFADSFRWPEWVRDLSPFAHVASVPAEPVDVPGALGMLAVAAALAVVGLVGYARRDLRG